MDPPTLDGAGWCNSHDSNPRTLQYTRTRVRFRVGTHTSTDYTACMYIQPSQTARHFTRHVVKHTHTHTHIPWRGWKQPWYREYTHGGTLSPVADVAEDAARGCSRVTAGSFTGIVTRCDPSHPLVCPASSYIRTPSLPASRASTPRDTHLHPPNLLTYLNSRRASDLCVQRAGHVCTHDPEIKNQDARENPSAN